eukprot:COSAG02_NODE_5329_length_4432_cov_6.439188_6_plen_207_part_00
MDELGERIIHRFGITSLRRRTVSSVANQEAPAVAIYLERDHERRLRAELGATHERLHAGLIHLSESEFGRCGAVNLESIAQALSRDFQLLSTISCVGWVLQTSRGTLPSAARQARTKPPLTHILQRLQVRHDSKGQLVVARHIVYTRSEQSVSRSDATSTRDKRWPPPTRTTNAREQAAAERVLSVGWAVRAPGAGRAEATTRVVP